jgi:predicted ATP-grasp superfamily ATP-dependent carboligase
MTGAAIDSRTPVVVLKFHHGSLGIARSLGRLGAAVFGVTSDRRLPGLGSRYLHGVFEWDVDGRAPSDTVSFLLDVGRRIGRPSILVPVSDGGAVLVAEHAAALRERFLFPDQDPALLRALVSKKEMHGEARRLGIPTPSTLFPRSRSDVEAAIPSIAFPVMLKAIDGARLDARAGIKMVRVGDAPELLSLYDQLEDPAEPNLMLQEYIPGGDDTVWMFNGYFDARSEPLFGVTGKKIRQNPVYTGATSLGICLANPTVERTTAAFMKGVGYRGILDIGYRFDARDGQYKVLDVNPRIGMTFRLFVGRDGMDVARALYLDLTGQAVAPSAAREGRKWVVEDKDLESCLQYARDGRLGWAQWLSSFRGVEEAAWFARDDWAPFWKMSAGLVRRLARRLTRGIRLPVPSSAAKTLAPSPPPPSAS